MLANSGQGNNGLTWAKELYRDRSQRVLQLKEQGDRVIGYHCCYVPAEILTAADIIPYRLTGDIGEQTTYTDSFLETQMCPYVRNCLEVALKGRTKFLDGMVIPHVCDAIQRIYGFWRFYTKPGYLHHLDVPHVFSDSAFRFFRKELLDFKESIERLTGKEISDSSLWQAIELHNENRALVRELYELRKEEFPPLVGSEVLQVLVAGMSLPVREFNDLLRAVISEVRGRTMKGENKPLRLLLYGCVVDDAALLELFENYGASVVMDDSPIGTRSFWFRVEGGADPLEAMARAYLPGVRCPRTIVGEKGGSYRKEVAERFGYLVDYARDYRAQGAVLYLLRFCDPHQFDVPDLQAYFQEMGIPTLLLDDDYTLGNLGRLRTRVESFLELLR